MKYGNTGQYTYIIGKTRRVVEQFSQQGGKKRVETLAIDTDRNIVHYQQFVGGQIRRVYKMTHHVDRTTPCAIVFTDNKY